MNKKLGDSQWLGSEDPGDAMTQEDGEEDSPTETQQPLSQGFCLTQAEVLTLQNQTLEA